MDRALINAIHSRLTEAARTDEEFVHYAEVIQMAGIGHLGEGALEGALGNLLYDVNQYDWSQDAHRPMLSAIAVSSQTRYPGGGFYRLARDKGKLSSRDEFDELTFWVKELEALRAYWQAHSRTMFRDVAMTADAVWEALKKFDTEYADPNDYRHWLDNDTYDFALEYGGRLYPPRHILEEVYGKPILKLEGGDQRHRVFKELGFVIVEKWQVGKSRVEQSGSQTYLLTWNPGVFPWDNFQEEWEAVHLSYRPELNWSCGNTKAIQAGDRVFLMRLGWRERITGLMASGWVIQEAFKGAHWNDQSQNQTAMYVDFEPDVFLQWDTEELFDPTREFPDFSWTPQRSGVSIPPEIAHQLEVAWEEHIHRIGVKPIGAPRGTAGLDAEPQTFKEGARSLVSGYQYERDPRARAACIKRYGTNCAVCEFNFGEVFGDIGKDFIHVHHLIPLSERAAEYEIDPIRDLRPVCPNCHAMLHRRSPPYSIEELKQLRRGNT